MADKFTDEQLKDVLNFISQYGYYPETQEDLEVLGWGISEQGVIGGLFQSPRDLKNLQEIKEYIGGEGYDIGSIPTQEEKEQSGIKESLENVFGQGKTPQAERAGLLTKLKEQGLMQQMRMMEQTGIIGGMALEEQQAKYGLSGGMALAQQQQMQQQMQMQQQPLQAQMAALPMEQQLLEYDIAQQLEGQQLGREQAELSLESQRMENQMALLEMAQWQQMYRGGGQQ